MQEVQAVCDSVVIINKGKLVANDKTDNLQKLWSSDVVVEVEFEQAITIEQLQQINGVQLVNKLSDTNFVLHGKDSTQLRKDIFTIAVNTNNPLLTLKQESKSLEDIFQQLTHP
ncbi:MAG TPA: hypothetical protein PLR84_09360, partial [Chitinophagales bacterium]|nr:hypothetical protein [Chitinophagales bacterium]